MPVYLVEKSISGRSGIPDILWKIQKRWIKLLCKNSEQCQADFELRRNDWRESCIKKQEDERMATDKINAAEEMGCWIRYWGGLERMEYERTILFKNNIDTDGLDFKMSAEHKKILWDSFIKDLKNPITEAGYQFESFVERCDGNVKELRAGIREIMRVLKISWGHVSIDVNEYVAELLDYAQKSGQGEEMQRTSALNSFCQNLSGSQKEGVVHDLSQLLCIMDKNIHGRLEPEDTRLLETSLPKWRKQIQEMRTSLENMF